MDQISFLWTITSAHTGAQWVYEYHKSEDIQRLEWPAISPDLNLIEHVWVSLSAQLQLKDQFHRPSTSTKSGCGCRKGLQGSWQTV
ncbi:hypothetical protein TNCV_500791 [Trichonephila clavipes]|nr:hypothetical protein TNCV_500791 [Trichonephila clavipes]